VARFRRSQNPLYLGRWACAEYVAARGGPCGTPSIFKRIAGRAWRSLRDLLNSHRCETLKNEIKPTKLQKTDMAVPVDYFVKCFRHGLFVKVLLWCFWTPFTAKRPKKTWYRQVGRKYSKCTGWSVDLLAGPSAPLHATHFGQPETWPCCLLGRPSCLFLFQLTSYSLQLPKGHLRPFVFGRFLSP
jgi:hypothetical protein